MFVEAKSSGQLDLVESGSGKLRLVEIISNKIFCISRPEQTLESLQVNEGSLIVSLYPHFIFVWLLYSKLCPRLEELRATD